MHELSIAESILDCVRQELLSHPGARPTRVGVRIGALSAVNPESLEFCFEAITNGTAWQSLKLDTALVPAQRICGGCGQSYAPIDYNSACPGCLSTQSIADGGDELDLEYLEIETDGTSAAQIESIE